jgi:thiol-disulfide isomerase/thioredoxin
MNSDQPTTAASSPASNAPASNAPASNAPASNPPVSNPPVRSTSPLFLGVAVVIVVVLLVVSYVLRQSVTTPVATGQSLSSLKLQALDLGSSEVDLSSLHGKIVLLNFWGTWCYPCRLELPELIELAEEFEGENFVFLPVSCPASAGADINTARSETSEYLSENEFEIETFYDARGTTRLAVAEAMELGGSFAYPTTVILDREGKVRGFWQGYSKGIVEQQRQALKKWTAE